MEQRKERPILFSGAMVRAILDGRKTQTRRVAKLTFWPRESDVLLCPFGRPGDRLWVRENGWERPERTPKMMRDGADTWAPYYFDADGYSEQDKADFKAWGFKRRPSIHMPRTASRITLEITAVRVERLNDCSEEDARAEGITDGGCTQCGNPEPCGCQNPSHDARESYVHLWEQINGAGSWHANPWVWVVEFKRL
ncbi:hypothetical protein KTE26_14160 [Ralstonia mannitolilytica]|uniref:hypothetical protein n=1 Tax=Ralstonia mannitolilytica TaxID=105219 RepID=UPI001C22B98B|nr:hypothetical protein [Ralstonia mannitolilytica]MBU9579574.1 hypothetical protein [Ralstonia mannitolilytica]